MYPTPPPLPLPWGGVRVVMYPTPLPNDPRKKSAEIFFWVSYSDQARRAEKKNTRLSISNSKKSFFENKIDQIFLAIGGKGGHPQKRLSKKKSPKNAIFALKMPFFSPKNDLFLRRAQEHVKYVTTDANTERSLFSSLWWHFKNPTFFYPKSPVRVFVEWCKRRRGSDTLFFWSVMEKMFATWAQKNR